MYQFSYQRVKGSVYEPNVNVAAPLVYLVVAPLLVFNTQRYLYPLSVVPPSELYARVAVVKSAYVIPVSVLAAISTQRVVALAVCLCHLNDLVPD